MLQLVAMWIESSEACKSERLQRSMDTGSAVSWLTQEIHSMGRTIKRKNRFIATFKPLKVMRNGQGFNFLDTWYFKEQVKRWDNGINHRQQRPAVRTVSRHRPFSSVAEAPAY